MPARSLIAGALLLLGLALSGHAAGRFGSRKTHSGPEELSAGLPEPQRELRGVWVATVDNIDWPSRPGLSTEQQKAELLALLDRASQLKLNAIIFQVRPACDALYDSRIEPWSDFLTGQMGRAPEPFYDPLAFAVEEAHRRGLELHAWFNPYRAHHPASKSEICATHVSRTHPELVRRYGKLLWLDPGEEAVQEVLLAVIMDVVRRYDVDGIHIDDYFYPYKDKDTAGNVLPFPDEPSWHKYRAGGGRLSRDDWRRQNVDRFVERLYKAVKAEKPWVKVGISPFGIWRPGHPEQIKGFDPYLELYADSRKWLVNGWADYVSPQLYWKIDQAAQSYPVLLQWWTEQNPKGRNVWPGNFTSRVADGGAAPWTKDEILNQIRLTRAQPGASGNIHFSMKSFMLSRAGIDGALATGLYAQPALVPASPWLDNQAPPAPRLEVRKLHGQEGTRIEREIAWEPSGPEKAWLWVVRLRTGDRWTTEILPGWRTSRSLGVPGGPAAGLAAVSAVDRCGNESPAAELKLGGQ